MVILTTTYIASIPLKETISENIITILQQVGSSKIKTKITIIRIPLIRPIKILQCHVKNDKKILLKIIYTEI